MGRGSVGALQLVPQGIPVSDIKRIEYRSLSEQELENILAATDGHAKNFSLFIESQGRYRLTPYYDIISMYPALSGRGIDRRDAKLAMGLAILEGLQKRALCLTTG